MESAARPPRRPREPAEGITDAAVRWGFRMLAGREPLNEAEFAAFQALPDMPGLRRTLANTHEFHAFFGALLTPHQAWTMPLFLLRPPSSPTTEWRFEPPSLDAPVCQMATIAQFAEPAFQEIIAAMGLRPGRQRAVWEQAWIIATLATAGAIAPGKRALGLETGRERIASVLAARGTAVTAFANGLADPQAIERRRLQLFHPEACPIEEFDARVACGPLDPREVGGLPAEHFDAAWSIGLPDQLGSIAAAMEVFEASLVPLRPGGIAAHVFSLNLASNGLTWEEPSNVLVRRRDIETLAERLREKGHALLPLNTHPGQDLADEQVQSELGGPAGHRQRRGMMVHAAFGLAIRKGA